MKNSNTNNISQGVVPVVSYIDSDSQKLAIYKENRKKSGVYLWTNKITSSRYIGSAIDLSRRFTNYFSFAFLNREVKTSSSIIYRALLKHGYSNFQLDILEYCDPSVLIEKEQYYLDMLNPEYNILRTAGSSMGYKHSEASLELIRAKSLKRERRTLSEATKSKISVTLSGRTHSEETKLKMIGRSHTKETKAKIGSNNYRIQPVLVRNIETGVCVEYPSMKKAAEFFNTNTSQIRNCIEKQKPFKDVHIIERKPKI